MGYRSDVRIVMSKNAYKELKKQVNEHIDNYKKNHVLKGSITDESGYDFNLLNKLDIFRQGDDENKLYFGWNWLKWYDGYEEVDAIMDSLIKLKDNGYGFSYGRLGESIEDYEEMYVKSTPKDNINYLEVPPLYRYFDDDNYENDLLKNKEEVINNEKTI